MVTQGDLDIMKKAMEEKVKEIMKDMDDMKAEYAEKEQAMKKEVEKLRMEKDELGVQMQKIQGELSKDGDTKPGGVLKGYDHKTAPRPNPYDFGDEHEFYAWKDLMVALMTSYDGRWEIILEHIEKMDKKVIDPNNMKMLQEKLAMDEQNFSKSVKILYTTLLQYTKGDARAKVTGCGMRGSWEAYRFIVNKGKNRTMTSIMQKRIRVMNPEQAKTVEEVEGKVQVWKTDMRILLECGQEQDRNMIKNEDQMITILISMLPERVAEHIMGKYEIGLTSLDELEEKLREHLDKIGDNQQRGRVVKKIGQVQAHAEEQEPEEDDWMQCWDQDNGSFWIRTAAKRQRTEENGDERGAGTDDADMPSQTKGLGKAKSKGKGKGGPKGGCHECGGNHYARDCTIRQQRKGGKGKGKNWDSVQPKYWNSWNPGFINRQWSSWRPGYTAKGKGKGKGGFPGAYGGKGEGMSSGPDINKLTFPPLCSVGSQNTSSGESEEWGDNEYWTGKGNDWAAESGIWLGLHAVTKKKQQTYSKTEDFDAAIHHAVTWKGPKVVEKNIDLGVPRETKVQCCQKEITTQDMNQCCGEWAVKSTRMTSTTSLAPNTSSTSILSQARASGALPKGHRTSNKFEALQSDEEEGEDDECVECNASESPRGKEKKGILKQISTLQKAVRKEKSVGACNEKKRGWQCLSVAVDSGACDNVIDPKDINAYEDRVEDTEASRNEEHFLAANGEEIPNYGQVKIPAITREKTVRGITFQAAGVSKGLLSVEKMNECGHVVIFDGDESIIINKKTGEINQLRRQDGNFMLDLWIPPPEVAQDLGFTWRP